MCPYRSHPLVLRRSFASITSVKRVVALVAVLLAAAGGGIAYQTAARARDYRALLARGDAAMRDDQTFGAIEAYSGAVALRPDSMLAHLRRAETYKRRGDLEAAARDFRAAAALDPSAVRPLDELGDVLYQMQRYRRAADVYESCLKLDDHSALANYKLALARYRDRNIDGAIVALRQAIHLNDRTAETYYLLGVCLRERRLLHEARDAFETAVSVSPGFIAGREELADVYGALGRGGDELEQLQVIAGLDRDHAERQVAVGLAHARAGHPDLAVLTLDSALERMPDQPVLYGALGRIWLDIAESRDDRAALAQALEALAHAAAHPTATSEVLTLYGRALLRDERFDLAERILEQATARYPVDPLALLFYSTAAERLDHIEAARRALIDYGALVSPSSDSDAVTRATRIASLSLRMDDTATAVEWLERTLETHPNEPRLLASLADVHRRK